MIIAFSIYCFLAGVEDVLKYTRHIVGGACRSRLLRRICAEVSSITQNLGFLRLKEKWKDS